MIIINTLSLSWPFLILIYICANFSSATQQLNLSLGPSPTSFVEDRWKIIAECVFFYPLYPKFHCHAERSKLPLTFFSLYMRTFLLNSWNYTYIYYIYMCVYIYTHTHNEMLFCLSVLLQPLSIIWIIFLGQKCHGELIKRELKDIQRRK